MSVEVATRFIVDLQRNAILQAEINACDKSAVPYLLESLGYEFSYDEFEKSVTRIHTLCKYENQVDDLMELVWQFRDKIQLNY